MIQITFLVLEYLIKKLCELETWKISLKTILEEGIILK